MTPSESELSSLLTDVRKSYRLLHDYQRLILDSVRYIGTQLDMNFCAGWTIFCDGQPKNGRFFPHDKWAWDWLGMYAYEFRFDLRHDNNRGIDIPENDFVTVAASVISDTGYFEEAEAHPDKTRVEIFKAAETSHSKVIFSLFRGPWRGLGDLYEPESINKLLRPGEPWLETLSNEGVYGFVENISSLFDEQSADQLVDRITKLAAETGLPIYKSGQAPEELEAQKSETPR